LLALGDTRYPEWHKAFLFMCDLYNKESKRRMDKADTGDKQGPKAAGSNSQVVSTAHRAGFARPDIEAKQSGQAKGLGHFYGPGQPIGRVTKVGKARKVRLAYGGS